MNQDMSIVSLLLDASFVVQLVVLILLGLSPLHQPTTLCTMDL
jgi:hypothetical protein